MGFNSNPYFNMNYYKRNENASLPTPRPVDFGKGPEVPNQGFVVGDGIVMNQKIGPDGSRMLCLSSLEECWNDREIYKAPVNPIEKIKQNEKKVAEYTERNKDLLKELLSDEEIENLQ